MCWFALRVTSLIALSALSAEISELLGFCVCSAFCAYRGGVFCSVEVCGRVERIAVLLNRELTIGERGSGMLLG